MGFAAVIKKTKLRHYQTAAQREQAARDFLLREVETECGPKIAAVLARRKDVQKFLQRARENLDWRHPGNLAATTPQARTTDPTPQMSKIPRPKCGARTRNGEPCKASVLWDNAHNKPRNGRCRLHGGLSTGPKTAAGKRRVRTNLRNF
ncbi:HGGxSTG domain-containing protein [Govanella unica]|uniref:HGGxSTG domain-containing protein n=1 Tax=Govanella unica TaxID=2975056 RepID=UPI003211A677